MNSKKNEEEYIQLVRDRAVKLQQFCSKYKNMQKDIPNGFEDILRNIENAKNCRTKWKTARKDLQVKANVGTSQMQKVNQRKRTVLAQNSTNTPVIKRKRTENLTSSPEETERLKSNYKNTKENYGLWTEAVNRGASPQKKLETRIQSERRDGRKDTVQSKQTRSKRVQP